MRPIVVLLTLPVVGLMTQPLWAPEWGAGILGELTALGTFGAIASTTVFLGLVALYCRSLIRLLAQVEPDDRARTPRSVWLMFAIPFNFIEDFAIVADIRTSLRRDGRVPRRHLARWFVLGIAWCCLQLGSLAPGSFGFAAGALALIAWALHWRHTSRLSRRLLAE